MFAGVPRKRDPEIYSRGRTDYGAIDGEDHPCTIRIGSAWIVLDRADDPDEGGLLALEILA